MQFNRHIGLIVRQILGQRLSIASGRVLEKTRGQIGLPRRYTDIPWRCGTGRPLVRLGQFPA